MTETESSDRGLSSYLDPVLTLAQTMHATSSAYAILLGAGVSIAAGVPSAWGVVENLSSRLAAQEHQDAGDDPAGWFCTRYGHDPRYEELLESLAPTQLERQRILAQFFEPSPGSVDGEPSRGQPSLAHRSVARLAAAGHLRVILTLNFDRLTETALREIGIEPTVVASVEDLAGLAPLHTLQALVVHLHGDYLSATTMLNTTTELGTYPATVNQFLDQVLTDYGLLIVGWSGAYDEALRAAMTRQTARHFTPYWIDPFPLQPLAEDLRTSRSAVKITTTADDALGRLADAVTALDVRAARHPLSLPVAVATAKRELNGQTSAVRLHDQLHTEFERLRRSPDQVRTTFDLAVGDTIDLVYGRVDEAMIVPCGIVATAAYWGDDRTDEWWLPEIMRYSHRPHGGGRTALIDAQTAPAGHLLYIAGIAATAARRWNLLHHLLSDLQITINGRREPIASWVTAPGKVYRETAEQAPSSRLHKLHAPTFVEHLALGRDTYDDAWEMFELLRLVQITFLQSNSAGAIIEIGNARGELDARQKEFAEAETSGSADDVGTAPRSRVEAWQEAGRALGRYAGLVTVDQPHVRVMADYDDDSWTNNQHPPVVGLRLLADLHREGEQHPLVRAGFGGGDPTYLQITVEAVNAAIGQAGRDAAYRQMGFSAGAVPDYFWLDTGVRPTR